jgi:hypothetical protein
MATASSLLTLTRQNIDWAMTMSAEAPSGAEPPNGSASSFTDRAERTEVIALLRRIAKLRIRRFMDDAPQVEQLPTFGFAEPAMELTLSHHGELSNPVRVFFGAPLTEDSTLLYAKRSDEPSLYAVAASDLESLVKDPGSLRTSSCFEAFADHVQRVEIVWEGRTLMIEQVDEQWRALGQETALDPQQVKEFLQQLTALRVGGFVENAPTDLAPFGLDPPSGHIALWQHDRQTPERVLVGALLPASGERYGRIEGRSAVVKLPASITDLLRMTADSLQQPPAPE